MEGHSRPEKSMCKVQKRHIGWEGEPAQQVWRMQGKEAETTGRLEAKQRSNGIIKVRFRWDRVGGGRVWNGKRLKTGFEVLMPWC